MSSLSGTVSAADPFLFSVYDFRKFLLVHGFSSFLALLLFFLLIDFCSGFSVCFFSVLSGSIAALFVFLFSCSAIVSYGSGSAFGCIAASPIPFLLAILCICVRASNVA